jgi:hypothetical protein
VVLFHPSGRPAIIDRKRRSIVLDAWGSLSNTCRFKRAAETNPHNPIWASMTQWKSS